MKATFLRWRYKFVLTLILLAVLGLFSRIIYLAIFEQSFLRKEGNQRTLRVVNSPAFRGTIFDRSGFPLAVSSIVDSIWINPQEWHANQSLVQVSQLLGLNKAQLQAQLIRAKAKHREFVYLKRGVAPHLAKKITALHIAGIYSQEEFKRFYPEGEITAHVIGFTNVDDAGQEGLEAAYNHVLQGTPGKKLVLKDRLGNILSEVEVIQAQKPGEDIVLSIDRQIQYLAYKALLDTVNTYNARSGMAVVIDTTTGEILALVNQPSFNPNDRSNYPIENYRNRAATDIFEPGSTIKSFTVAAALEGKFIQADAIIDTSPGWMRLDKSVVKDEHNNGPLSLAQILQKSSNMGASKIVLSMPANRLRETLAAVGFGADTGASFPGESYGILHAPPKWGDFTLATLSFGYGMSATLLQLARAYNTFAHQGRLLPLSVLRRDTAPSSVGVFSPETAATMLNLLETVVNEGTGKKARIKGYRIAGKTGTVLIAGAGGYKNNHYNASFVGIGPVSEPRLLVAVIVQDLEGKYHSGTNVAAPLFANIMQGALRILNVAPDKNS